MNNLNSKSAIIFCFVSIFAVSCSAGMNGAPSIACVEDILKAKVVRADDKNHRFFVVSNTIKASDIKNNLSSLRKCFAGTTWHPDWALSVFTDSKYAGYKDEEAIIPFHKQNMWANAYIFEYDQANKGLIKNPATKPEYIMP